jgi:hypothetical protein
VRRAGCCGADDFWEQIISCWSGVFYKAAPSFYAQELAAERVPKGLPALVPAVKVRRDGRHCLNAVCGLPLELGASSTELLRGEEKAPAVEETLAGYSPDLTQLPLATSQV